MTQPIVTTGRLRLVPFSEADFPLLLDLHSDPEVNRYLSPGFAPMDAGEVRHRLGRYLEDHRLFGISKWKLETLDGAFVDRAGFSWQSRPQGFELGYSLKRSAWGRGYATEIAGALVGWFFEQRPEPHLLAYAVADEYQPQQIGTGLTVFGDCSARSGLQGDMVYRPKPATQQNSPQTRPLGGLFRPAGLRCAA